LRIGRIDLGGIVGADQVDELDGYGCTPEHTDLHD
jgi:hypothetical protein